jgi:hypothetical protein
VASQAAPAEAAAPRRGPARRGKRGGKKKKEGSRTLIPTLEVLITRGLTGPGQRCAAIRALLTYLRDIGWGRSESIASVEQWLREKHNDCSTDYNANPAHAISFVKVAAKAVFGPSSWVLRLSPAIVAYIGKSILRGVATGRIVLKPGKVHLRNLLIFSCQLISFMRLNTYRSGEAGRPIAWVAASLMQRMCRGSGRKYSEHCDYLEKLGIITRLGDASWLEKRAGSIAINLQLIPVNDSEPDLYAAFVSAFSIAAFLGPQRVKFFDNTSWWRFRERTNPSLISMIKSRGGSKYKKLQQEEQG